jgi:hypothetical protein
MNIKSNINQLYCRLKKSKTAFIIIGLIAVLWFWHCPFRMVGLSCPGCGMKSALWSLLLLDFQAAFYYHPLWPLPIVVFGYILIKHLFKQGFTDRVERGLFSLMILMFVGVYLYRLLVIDSQVVRFTLFK